MLAVDQKAASLQPARSARAPLLIERFFGCPIGEPIKSSDWLDFDRLEIIKQIITANEAKARFGELIDRVQREPVRVTRHNRVVGVMVSPGDYAAMRDFYADRLARTLGETTREAAEKGLTEDELARLLSDEG